MLKLEQKSPNQIREIREELGLTQQEFANFLGCGISTVAKWEGKTHKMSAISARLLETKLREAREHGAHEQFKRRR